MKVVNLFPSAPKKVSVSKPTKFKFVEKGQGIILGTPEVCFDIIPYVENLSPIGNTVLESTLSFAVRSYSTKNFATVKPKPPLLRKLSDAPPSSRTCGSKRKTSSLVSSAPLERRVYYL